MRVIIILLLLVLSTPVLSDHPQEYDEFEAQEQLMQYQLNMWELLAQLRYAKGELRVRVLEEIHEMQKLINQQLLKIVELDQKYHGK